MALPAASRRVSFRGGEPPVELIADMLGHTTTVMLQRRCRRRIRPSADAAVGTMDQLFGQA